MRWFLTDRTTGRYVVAQWPNPPLWLWIVATLAHRVTGAAWLSWVATTALGAWALLELVRGQSPFRRLLGAAVLAATVLGLLG